MAYRIVDHADVLQLLAEHGRSSCHTLWIRFLSVKNNAALFGSGLARLHLNFDCGVKCLEIWLDESTMPKAYVCTVLYNLSREQYKSSFSVEFYDEDTKCAERCMQMLIFSKCVFEKVSFNFEIEDSKLTYLIAKWIQKSILTKNRATICLPARLLSKSIASYRAIMSSSIKASAPAHFIHYTDDTDTNLMSWFAACSKM